MTCIRMTRLKSMNLSATTQTQYAPVTGWMPCTGLDKVKPVLINKASAGNITTQPYYQLAAVRTDNPDSPVTFGESKQGDGSATAAAPVDISSATTGSKYYIRFGVAYSSTSTGTADVGLALCLENYGKVVGSAALSLNPPPQGGTWYRPVTEWLPTPMVTKAKAAFIKESGHSDFRYKLAWQFATDVPQLPGAWTSEASPRSDTEVCSSEITITPDANQMWVRFGVAYLTASAANIQGDLAVSVAIRK